MNKLKVFLFSAVLVVIAACTKYDEGSNFSLLTPKARLVNTWTMTKYEVNGSDETVNNAGLEIIFYKDNTFKRTFIFGFQVSEDGDWTFADGKERLILTKKDGTIEGYTIVKLKNKEFKAKRTDDNGNTFVYSFKGK